MSLLASQTSKIKEDAPSPAAMQLQKANAYISELSREKEQLKVLLSQYHQADQRQQNVNDKKSNVLNVFERKSSQSALSNLSQSNQHKGQYQRQYSDKQHHSHQSSQKSNEPDSLRKSNSNRDHVKREITRITHDMHHLFKAIDRLEETNEQLNSEVPSPLQQSQNDHQHASIRPERRILLKTSKKNKKTHSHSRTNKQFQSKRGSSDSRNSSSSSTPRSASSPSKSSNSSNSDNSQDHLKDHRLSSRNRNNHHLHRHHHNISAQHQSYASSPQYSSTLEKNSMQSKRIQPPQSSQTLGSLQSQCRRNDDNELIEEAIQLLESIHSNSQAQAAFEQKFGNEERFLSYLKHSGDSKSVLLQVMRLLHDIVGNNSQNYQNSQFQQLQSQQQQQQQYFESSQVQLQQPYQQQQWQQQQYNSQIIQSPASSVCSSTNQMPVQDINLGSSSYTGEKLIRMIGSKAQSYQQGSFHNSNYLGVSQGPLSMSQKANVNSLPLNQLQQQHERVPTNHSESLSSQNYGVGRYKPNYEKDLRELQTREAMLKMQEYQTEILTLEEKLKLLKDRVAVDSKRISKQKIGRGGSINSGGAQYQGQNYSNNNNTVNSNSMANGNLNRNINNNQGQVLNYNEQQQYQQYDSNATDRYPNESQLRSYSNGGLPNANNRQDNSNFNENGINYPNGGSQLNQGIEGSNMNQAVFNASSQNPNFINNTIKGQFNNNNDFSQQPDSNNSQQASLLNSRGQINSNDDNRNRQSLQTYPNGLNQMGSQTSNYQGTRGTNNDPVSYQAHPRNQGNSSVQGNERDNGMIQQGFNAQSIPVQGQQERMDQNNQLNVRSQEGNLQMKANLAQPSNQPHAQAVQGYPLDARNQLGGQQLPYSFIQQQQQQQQQLQQQQLQMQQQLQQQQKLAGDSQYEGIRSQNSRQASQTAGQPGPCQPVFNNTGQVGQQQYDPNGRSLGQSRSNSIASGQMIGGNRGITNGTTQGSEQQYQPGISKNEGGQIIGENPRSRHPSNSGSYQANQNQSGQQQQQQLSGQSPLGQRISNQSQLSGLAQGLNGLPIAQNVNQGFNGGSEAQQQQQPLGQLIYSFNPENESARQSQQNELPMQQVYQNGSLQAQSNYPQDQRDTQAYGGVLQQQQQQGQNRQQICPPLGLVSNQGQLPNGEIGVFSSKRGSFSGEGNPNLKEQLSNSNNTKNNENDLEETESMQEKKLFHENFVRANMSVNAHRQEDLEGDEDVQLNNNNFLIFKQSNNSSVVLQSKDISPNNTQSNNNFNFNTNTARSTQSNFGPNYNNSGNQITSSDQPTNEDSPLQSSGMPVNVGKSLKASQFCPKPPKPQDQQYYTLNPAEQQKNQEGQQQYQQQQQQYVVQDPLSQVSFRPTNPIINSIPLQQQQQFQEQQQLYQQPQNSMPSNQQFIAPPQSQQVFGSGSNDQAMRSQGTPTRNNTFDQQQQQQQFYATPEQQQQQQQQWNGPSSTSQFNPLSNNKPGDQSSSFNNNNNNNQGYPSTSSPMQQQQYQQSQQFLTQNSPNEETECTPEQLNTYNKLGKFSSYNNTPNEFISLGSLDPNSLQFQSPPTNNSSQPAGNPIGITTAPNRQSVPSNENNDQDSLEDEPIRKPQKAFKNTNPIEDSKSNEDINNNNQDSDNLTRSSNNRLSKGSQPPVVHDYMKKTQARVNYAKDVHKEYLRRSNTVVLNIAATPKRVIETSATPGGAASTASMNNPNWDKVLTKFISREDEAQDSDQPGNNHEITAAQSLAVKRSSAGKAGLHRSNTQTALKSSGNDTPKSSFAQKMNDNNVNAMDSPRNRQSSQQKQQKLLTPRLSQELENAGFKPFSQTEQPLSTVVQDPPEGYDSFSQEHKSKQKGSMNSGDKTEETLHEELQAINREIERRRTIARSSTMKPAVSPLSSATSIPSQEKQKASSQQRANTIALPKNE